jgi:hypothetical protein
MNDLAFALLFIGGGAILAVHCSRMTWKEVRTGVATSQLAKHSRSGQPVSFWIIILGNAFAALLGAVFLVVGLTGLFFALVPVGALE